MCIAMNCNMQKTTVLSEHSIRNTFMFKIWRNKPQISFTWRIQFFVSVETTTPIILTFGTIAYWVRAQLFIDSSQSWNIVSSFSLMVGKRKVTNLHEIRIVCNPFVSSDNFIYGNECRSNIIQSFRSCLSMDVFLSSIDEIRHWTDRNTRRHSNVTVELYAIY